MKSWWWTPATWLPSPTGVSYDIGKVGGLGSLVLGGEGLVMKFRGTGVVWVQTRALPALAAMLQPLLKSD